MEQIDPKERYKYAISLKESQRVSFAESKNRCDACMLKKHICVCAQLDALTVRDIGFDMIVVMNHKEQFRASNTAKIIQKVLGARIFIDGLHADMQDLEQLIDQRKDCAIVLFPSDNAVECKECDLVNKISNCKKDGLNTHRRPLIIVLDGTWSQARRLNNKISESISRVKIMPTTLSQFLCRKQTQTDRVCTAEALALLMVELGFDVVAQNLEKGLATVVEGFNLQCFNSPLRPASMLKKTPKGNSIPPRHPNSLIKT